MPDGQNPFSVEFLRDLPAYSDQKDGFLNEISGGISKLRLMLSHLDHSKLTEEQHRENKDAIARADQLASDIDTSRQQFLKGLVTREHCMDCVRELCEDWMRDAGQGDLWG
jgi:hypothetical protein